MKPSIKPIVGIITSEIDLLDEVLSRLERFFGARDVVGPWREFDHTSYYEPEMGPGLKRCFVSFSNLLPPASSTWFKEKASGVEAFYLSGGKRRMNIDPGYIDANKVVLMTGKDGGHKIPVAEGIWADFLLWYNKGWVAHPWAFPDFRDGGYFKTFMRMRLAFKKQLKSLSES